VLDGGKGMVSGCVIDSGVHVWLFNQLLNRGYALVVPPDLTVFVGDLAQSSVGAPR